MVDNLVDEAVSIMEMLHVFSYDDDIIDSVMRNQAYEPDDTFLEYMGETVNSLKDIERLIEILCILREKNSQEALWDRISSQGKSPAAFQALCFGLMENSGKPKQVGVILYVTLLGLNALNLLWNPIIFNNILSIMIAASQAIETPKVIGEEEKYCIHLTAKALKMLSFSLNRSFLNLAGSDVVIALIEISMKMLTIYQKELEKYSQKLAPAALQFLNAASETNLLYILPFLVLGLVLDFLPAGKTVTNKISQIRDTLLQFSKDHLSNKTDLLILLIKHVFTRSPERAAVRENSAIVVHSLIKYLDDPQQMINFLLQTAKAQKASYRSLSLDLFRLFINDEDGFLTDEIEIEMVDRMKCGINDTVPSVRASAINAITSLIPKADDRVLAAIGLNDDRLIASIDKRIRDEKLVVRKATLRLIQAMIFRSETPDFFLFTLIAARVRDRSVTMRQEAATILTKCLPTFNFPKRLITIWFDSILPLALDTDTRTQDFALKLIDSQFLQPMCTEVGVEMAKCLSDEYRDILLRVFMVYRQKSINLSPFCRTLQKKLSETCDSMLWKIADILLSVVPEHFHKKYIEFWCSRDLFPIEYLLIVGKLHLANKDIITDCLEYLKSIPALAHQESTNKNYSFKTINAYVQIIVNQTCQDKNEITASIEQIVDSATKLINSTVSDSALTQQKLLNLVPSIYLVGELIALLKNANDFNFTGLQILIGAKLPNKLDIPSRVRAISCVSIGKLCLGRRDITNSFVAAFAHILHNSIDPVIKCNCLIVLCDLCVKYTATVDSYVMDMSGCFADPSPVVRRQALLIMTRLIAEDYVKMKPLLFFRYVFSLVDPDVYVSQFAQSCLFDVLNEKDNKLLAQHFIDALFYFNDHIDILSLNEDSESHSVFRISSKARRVKAYRLMIERMGNGTLFELLQASCVKSLQSFLDGTMDIEDGESLLSDTFDVMMMIEDVMEAVNITEANVDDPKGEHIVEQSRIYMSMIHDHLIKRVLPILNQMHRYLRDAKSPLQSELRRFFRKLCQKHPNLLDELQKQEPILAAELEHDIAMTQTPDLDFSQPSSPIHKTPFRSPLLSKIAKTPTNTMVAPSGSQSPLSILSQTDLSQADNEDGHSQKRPPIPFRLDDE